ncbi:MAG TPA: glycerol-3-phosphate 1-O-acyltransferase PlsY [Firmicutes bacterium]|jgi:glycerol-3-phosphate acyltransferase PlsY|nr:glycerol-3-phosphate 1-O-acyltransferase PlsY [Bacillota bacterium]
MSVILVIFSYLLGSVSFGYLIAKRVKNVDIRKMGSGNTGATNISRVLGIKYALIVFALDLGKGLLAVLLAKWLLPSPWVTIFCAYGVLLGHNWPLYFSFKGGRGAATALGIFFGIMPIAALIVFGIIIVIILVARYVSVASITGAILMPFCVPLFDYPREYLIFGLSITVLIIWRHIPNIKRLLRGKELKIGEKVDIAPKGR